MIKWEYITVHILESSRYESELNEWGSQGWELVSVDYRNIHKTIHIFKRQTLTGGEC